MSQGRLFTGWVVSSPYRYTLGRRWAPGGRLVLFVMLNPSTADTETDDPTIRRCIGFGRREGYAGLRVVNLFAWRATKPESLLGATDPVGNPETDRCVGAQARECDGVVVAWGAWGARFPSRVEAVCAILTRHHEQLWCLGHTKSGQPRHPLFVAKDEPLVRWGEPTP